MKILIADKLSAAVVAALEAEGATVTVQPDLKAEELPAAIGDSEVLVVRSTRVNGDTIRAGKSLSLIIRAGAGVNTIDLETAGTLGVYVTNCPGKNTDAVAELAIGLMIACDRRIVEACTELRQGRWNKKEYQKAGGLKGRTLGIIGLGAIGRAVASRARGLEMPVIAWSRSLTPDAAEALDIGFCASPAAVAEGADVVSVHLAAGSGTTRLLDAGFFARMKPGALFINTARGEVVDTAAMLAAARERGIRLGLDVFEGEPAAAVDDFAARELAETAVCTPHIGASTDQASEATGDEVVAIVRAYRETGKPLNAVNIRSRTSAITNIVIRHYNKVGVLAGILDALRGAQINIEEMENTIFESGAAASCTIKLDSRPEASLLESIRTMEHVIEADLKE